MARKLRDLIPWQGFAPDADPMTPGVIRDNCQMVVANNRGIETYPRPMTTSAQVGMPTSRVLTAASGIVGGVPFMVASSAPLAGLRLHAAGMTSAGPAAWSNVTRSTAYTIEPDATWQFETFGNVVLAAYGPPSQVPTSTPLQAMAWGGLFANVATAPRASIVVAASGFVLLFNVNNAVDFPNTDGWWCSARWDHTNWTLTAGASTRGRLVDSAGPITAAIEFNGSVYAFKPNAIYRGDYVPGSTEVWQWTKLPFKVGCNWKFGVCKDDTKIYFLGADDLYSFDGANLRPLMVGRVKRWFWENFGTPNLLQPQQMVQVVHDRSRNEIVLRSQTGRTTIYHIPTDRFGQGDIVYECLVEQNYPLAYAPPPLWGFKDTDHRAYAITGPFDGSAGNAVFTLHAIGDDRETIETCEIRLRLAKQAGILSGVPSVQETLSGAATDLPEVPLTADGKLEIDANARLLNVAIWSSGHFESLGLLIDSTAQGAT